MILKQSDNASVQPVARIMPVLAVENIGSVVQELGDRATQFVKGQAYFAHIISKINDTAYNVKVDVADPKSGLTQEVILKMELGSAVKAGQTILLRHLHNSPVPTFLLAPSASNTAGSTTDISSTASLIGKTLKQAESDGISSRFQATAVVTHSPNNAHVVAHDLRKAVTGSGLFYESHLSDLVTGNQTLAAIKQEPQNQSNSPLTALMSQQLAILEHQRMSWHGEVWPGQNMDWDIYQESRNQDESDQWLSEPQAAEDRPMSSELTLHLPHLGKVSAKIILVDGRMRINILADQPQTLEMLNQQRLGLAEAIERNGQQLDALTLMQHDRPSV
jgi:hypothetical protein